MINFLNTTKIEKGLVVKATLTNTVYQTGTKISDEQMDALNLHKHETLPKWNYTIRP
ncbi:MAG: hypothetical protein JXB30_11295 [Anaerolineae bacterium]|nr:hypothetical protein [Anaerolineae bacterium]